MNKKEFLTTLENGIHTLPKIEKERIFNYYHETLEDRIEDGLNEEEAVQSMEDVQSIIAQALSEYQVQEDKPIEVKKGRGLRYTLLLLASPFIGIFLCTLLTMYIALWFLFLALLFLLLGLILFVVLGIVFLIRTLRLNVTSGIVLVGCIFIAAGACPWIYKFISKALNILKQIWLYGLDKLVYMWEKAVN